MIGHAYNPQDFSFLAISGVDTAFADEKSVSTSAYEQQNISHQKLPPSILNSLASTALMPELCHLGLTLPR